MQSLTRTNAFPGKVVAGRAISALPVLFLVFDGVIKVIGIQPVIDSFVRLGFRPGIAAAIGFLELGCLAVYLIPRTSLAGAVLLTGFLGGAIATHLRMGDPLFTHVLFPTYVAALLWGGLLLRDGRLRSLLFPPASTAH
jgi:hypothetical protein